MTDWFQDWLNNWSIAWLIDGTTQDQKRLVDFQHFVSANAHLFMEKSIPDVVQLAIQESQGTHVYSEARTLVAQRAEQGKIYFEWW